MRYSGDPDQLPHLGAALLRYGRRSADQRRDADRACAEISGAADAVVRRLEAALRSAQATLAATDPEDDAAMAAALRAVETATGNLRVGREQRARIERTLAELRARIRPKLQEAVRTTELGRTRLLAFWRMVDRTVSAFESAVASWSGRSSSTVAEFPAGAVSSNAPAERMTAMSPGGSFPPPERIGPGSHVLVPLELVDDADSPVRGGADFGKVSLRVMRDGLMRLVTGVLPAVRAGAGLAEMRELDAGAGLTGAPASHVKVYEAFFGDTSVKLTRRPDGRYEVRNGYHRVWLARQAGIDSLPAAVSEESCSR